MLHVVVPLAAAANIVDVLVADAVDVLVVDVVAVSFVLAVVAERPDLDRPVPRPGDDGLVAVVGPGDYRDGMMQDSFKNYNCI